MSATITVVGRLGKDPEIKFMADGTAVCSFSIASDVYDKSVEGKKRAVWYKVSLWGKAGERVGALLQKGSTVFVSGALDLREFEAKDGKKGVALEVKAYVVDFVGPRPKGEAEGAPARAHEASKQEQFNDDDLPF